MRSRTTKINRTLHWISSALGLSSLFFFSITGITLNHPEWFSSRESFFAEEKQLTDSWRQGFQQSDDLARLELLTQEISKYWKLGVPRNIDRDDIEWVMDYQRPGGMTTVIMDLETGVLSMEKVSDGLVALINDLHKGRHSGTAWSVFIDIAAVVCLFFSATGLVLLWVHGKKRPSTWPLVVTGSLLPLFLYLVFVP